MKKTISYLLLVLVLLTALTACGKEGQSGKEGEKAAQDSKIEKGTATSGSINVISREDGSGTRGAFVEIVGVEAEVDGKKEDATVETAVIAKTTNELLTSVAGDDRAIGYVSLGSVNSNVKALKVDGVEATEENVQKGEYKIQRPFLLVYKAEKDLSVLAKDFLSYMLSKEGQEIVKESYVAVDSSAKNYEKKEGLSGEISITGSTSVGPLVAKVAEAYMAINPGVKIEIQETGSGTGIKEAIAGNVDLGMSSRALKAEEKLESSTIAKDGIAVIVSPNNSNNEISTEQVRDIYLGNIKNWEELSK